MLLFASCRELVGKSNLDISLHQGGDVSDIKAKLADLYPELKTIIDTVSVACNEEYVDDTAILNDGDEIALIPPVSGG